MIIFPLDSWLERGILIAIAVILGLIYTMFQWPRWWSKYLGKGKPKDVEHAKVDKAELDKFMKDKD